MQLWKGFQRPQRVEVDSASLTDTYGRFSAQPFERGFGTTVGNALRRCLLSSIEGAAITRDQIEGYMALKWDEIYQYEHTPHPVEFQLYYSC